MCENKAEGMKGLVSAIYDGVVRIARFSPKSLKLIKLKFNRIGCLFLSFEAQNSHAAFAAV